MESIQQDLAYALRNLRKTPGFAVMAVLTLALGIGASTAIFSVLENVLMEPFPYPDSDHFMCLQIHNTDRNDPDGRAAFLGPEFLDYVEQNHVFDRIIGMNNLDVLYRSSAGTQLLDGIFVSPGTFELLGMSPLLGRVMQPTDYEPGAPPVFVLRYKTWLKEFGADPTILNKTFVLNGTARTLIGIMPPRFGWGDADVWIPEKPIRTAENSAQAGPFLLWFFLGHLKPGVSPKQAVADMTVIANRLAKIYPNYYPKHFAVETPSLTDMVVGRFRTTLYIVFAAVGLLLLIGCGNVANLLLARATTREKEFAIRSALGASRLRLILQLLVESLILAIVGAVLGTLLAWGGLKFLVALTPQDFIPAETVIRLNSAVLLFTLGVTFLTTLTFGLLPALTAARKDLQDPLRAAGKGLSGSFRHGQLRKAVIVVEVVLSLTLMVSAGLLMRSFVALREVQLGFAPDHVLLAKLSFPEGRYKTANQVAGFYRPLLLRLEELPGVVAATVSLPEEIPYGGWGSDIEITGKTHSEKWGAMLQLSSEGFFPVLKLPFLVGRSFTEAEVTGALKLAVVNQTFVKKYLPGDNPIGRQVRIAALAEVEDKVPDPMFEIIGVVADAKNLGLQDPPMPEIWIPYTVTGSAFGGILVRTKDNPLTMLNAVRHEVWATDPTVALTHAGSMQGYISQSSYATPRFGSVLMMIFSVIGLILVTIGVYSVLSYTTARRTQEIAIRMALGAQGSDVLAMVIRMGLWLIAVGVVLGLLVSVAVARIIATQLWGVSAYDPWTLICVPVVLLTTGFLACWFPARRAARVDPLVALRYE
jgi:putative ABC transport system permease protein